MPLCLYSALFFKSRGFKNRLSKPLTWSFTYILGGTILSFVAGQYLAMSLADSFFYLSANFASLYMSAVVAEYNLKQLLCRFRVSSKRGGQIIRFAQIAGFYLPFALVMVLTDMTSN